MFGKAGYTLRTFSILNGMPIHNNQGDYLGSICDLVISDDGTVKGLLMNRKNLFKKPCMIPLSDVESFDTSGITVLSSAKISPLNHEKVYTLQHQRAIANKMIKSVQGENMGLLDDVYFSEKLGTIVAYEISNGFFSDITEGKKMIHAEKPPSLEQDTIVISD